MGVKTEKWRASRFNHFVRCGEGKRLAFNAITCGLAEMDDENYATFLALAEGNNGNGVAENNDLLANLKKGGFLVPAEMDELDALRAGHYAARFSGKGFGLTIIPTFNCNFACDYCYEDRRIHSMSASEGGLMSDEICRNLIKLCEEKIPEKSAFTVTWYGGEPILAKGIIEKLTAEFRRICESRQSQYYAGIITNGYLLTPDNLKFLIDSGVTFAQVTVDGPEEIHDRRRTLKNGRGSYHKIMENLAAVQADGPFRVSIRINIDRRNKGGILPLLLDFKNRGFHAHKNISIYFSQVIHYSHSCPDIASQCMVTREFSEFMVEAYHLALDMGFRIAIYPAVQIGTCGAVGIGSAVIEPNGDVQNCWNTIGEKDKKTGRLTERGIEYDHLHLKWLGWDPFRPECRDCAVLPLCMGGCPYKTLYGEGIEDSRKNTCTWWKHNLNLFLPIFLAAKQKNQLLIPRTPSTGKPNSNVITNEEHSG